MSQDYLILIAIGPIQDFIAAARKTRDFYAGSHLLSEASKQCAEYLQNRGAILIFPHAPKGIVANKILAEWHGAEPPAKLAEKCKAHLTQWIAQQFDNLKLSQKIDSAFQLDLTATKTQLQNLLEFYAAWIPTTKSTYKSDRATLEQILAARKNLRDFSSHQGSDKPKSSLDGNRESVIAKLKADVKLQKFEVKPGELLDGLGVFKRFVLLPRKYFESTHDVAAESFIAGLRPSVTAQYKSKYPQGVPFSYSHIYHEDSEYKDLVKPAVDVVKKERKPQPAYYGIFMGDGDFMGDAIGKLASAADHRTFSSELSRFADSATKVVAANDAQPVYAGGDDVLAFLPLHKALECMSAVRKAFQDSMSGYDVSFSAGLAVCHALDPLTESRRYAESAEKAAKSIERKNAFCITVVPRSGAEVSFKGKWAESFDLLERVVDLYFKSELTLSLAHEFRKLLSEWEPNPKLDQHLNAMAIAIARKKQSKDPALKLIEDFFKLPGESRDNLKNLTDCLYVARPFARAKRESTHYQRSLENKQ